MVKPEVQRSYSSPESAICGGLSSCIVPLRAAAGHPPLFCLYDGNFGDMAAVLRTDRAVYAVGYSCSDDVKSSLTIECLAASHLTEIFKVQPRGPYYLIGYSIGAIVAYEMATSLVRMGECVGLLALIDIYNPALYHVSTTEAVQFRRRYRADRIMKYRENLMRGDFYKIAVDASKLLNGKLRALAETIFGKVFAQTSNSMLHAYSPKEFQGRLVLFRAEKPMDGGTEFDHDPSLGWSNCAKEGVDVRFVAGTHGTVMAMPHVIDLATKLEPYLNNRTNPFPILENAVL